MMGPSHGVRQARAWPAVALLLLIAILPSRAGAATFGSIGASAAIYIPESGSASGAGDPYPFQFMVSGLPGEITDLTAGLGYMAHNNPRDIDLLLVGPQGQQVMLMSDACGSDLILNELFFFDDNAPAGLPMSACKSGRYQPTNYQPDGNLPPPAPPVSGFAYPADLFAFKGTNPNGVWRAFAYDDAVQGTNGGRGGVSGLEVNILIPAKCRGVTVTDVGANKRRDFVVGSRKRDVMTGLGGGDSIKALRGNDLACGGKGRDRIIGGPGRDILLGGEGSDRLLGGKGRDLCIGGPQKDRTEGCERRRGI